MIEESMDAMLSNRYPALYASIKQKSIGELQLSMRERDTRVGFGKVLDFYMFWIREKQNGRIYFKARIEFIRKLKGNTVKLRFCEENKTAIFHAIDQIYQSYRQMSASGDLEEEIRKLEEKREQEGTASIRKIRKEFVRLKTAKASEDHRKADSDADEIARQPDHESELMRRWKDAVALCNENSAQNGGVPNEEAIQTLMMQGRRFASSFDHMLRIMIDTHDGTVAARRIKIYQEYIEFDRTTLSAIALNLDVSRERVRQIVKAANKTLSSTFKRMLRQSDHEEFYRCVESIIDVLKEAEYHLENLAVYGFCEIGVKKRQAIFKVLFGRDLAEEWIVKAQSVAQAMQKKAKALQKEEEKNEAWNLFRSKICYPSDFTAEQSVSLETCESEKKYRIEKDVYARLKKFESNMEILQDPDIVYYANTQTDHRPHFLLRLPDGTSVLVLALNAINMALIYNVHRCNGLHRFCKDNGYGYLIMDARGDTIYDIKNRVVDSDLTERFDDLLNRQSMIVWNDIKQIKQDRPVANQDIAAYVLQKKLHFTLKPFCIKYREKM